MSGSYFCMTEDKTEKNGLKELIAISVAVLLRIPQHNDADLRLAVRQ